MDISGTGIKHITMFDRQYTPESRRRDWQSLRPSCLGIVTSAPFCHNARHRGLNSRSLPSHGVCIARQKSLRICKRRTPDGH